MAKKVSLLEQNIFDLVKNFEDFILVNETSKSESKHIKFKIDNICYDYFLWKINFNNTDANIYNLQAIFSESKLLDDDEMKLLLKKVKKINKQ